MSMSFRSKYIGKASLAHLTKPKRNLAVQTIEVIIQKQLSIWFLTMIKGALHIEGKRAAGKVWA